MTLNEYQKKAMLTCMDTCDNFNYMMLNLVGEVGEFASKVAKALRKENIYLDEDISENDFCTEDEGAKYSCSYLDKLSEKRYKEFLLDLQKEAGDILWQLSGLCKVMGWNLEDVAKMNLDKLAARQKAGTIDGNGDGVSGAERTK